MEYFMKYYMGQFESVEDENSAEDNILRKVKSRWNVSEYITNNVIFIIILNHNKKKLKLLN